MYGNSEFISTDTPNDLAQLTHIEWVSLQELDREPGIALKKYEGAAFLLAPFGCISIGVAIIFVFIRRRVYHDAHSLDTAFDAGGDVSTSMTAVTFASQLLWPSDLMQSVTLCVKLGIAGAFWYCGTAIINMSIFPMLSYKFKTRAPGAKTYVQIIKARFGTTTHVVFIFFALLVILVIMSTVFVGGISVIQATITDASPEFCVVILAALCGGYALIGSLGSVFYVSYFNAVVTYVLVSIFVIKVVYSDDEPFGSLEEMYDRVNCLPGVDGNRDGSRFTFLSEEAMINAAQILFLVSSITYCDQASWQKRIAARPLKGAVGLILGSFLWFTVPATIGLVAGVAYTAEAAKNHTFAMNMDQVGAGIITSYMTEEAFGKGGAIMMLTMLIMVAMSTGSAEIIAMSSIIVYDIYQTYVRPFRRNLHSHLCVCCGLAKPGLTAVEFVNEDATTAKCECPHASKCSHCKQDVANLRMAHRAPGQVTLYTCPHHSPLRSYQDQVFTFKAWCVLWVTVAMIPFGVLLHAVELDLNWTIMAGVVFTVPAFPSVVLAILWAKTTAVGMVIGSISGLIAGCAADFVVGYYKYNWDGGFIPSTSAPYSVLAGSGGGFFISLVLTFFISLCTHNIKSQEDEDAVWQKLRNIDNPLNPWSAKIAEEFPDLTDGSYRPSQAQLDEATKSGKYVSIAGGVLFILLFIFITPGVLASLEVMTFDEFKIWMYVNTIALFVATAVVTVVTPIEEVKGILKELGKTKRKSRKAAAGDMGRENKAFGTDDVPQEMTEETGVQDTAFDTGDNRPGFPEY